MKIQRYQLPSPQTIEEFAEDNDLTMVIRESLLVDMKMYTASFELFTLDGFCVFGSHRTEQGAINDYARKISGKVLVGHFRGDPRRPIQLQVPRLVFE